MATVFFGRLFPDVDPDDLCSSVRGRVTPIEPILRSSALRARAAKSTLFGSGTGFLSTVFPDSFLSVSVTTCIAGGPAGSLLNSLIGSVPASVALGFRPVRPRCKARFRSYLPIM